jgi:glutathione S-transferase
MMTLYSSPASPFVRKVRIVADLKGLAANIQHKMADTNVGDPDLNRRNPLAKIPCLLLESGEAIFDSHVICEYLDATGTGPTLLPAQGAERWRTLTLGALADGVIDAALLMVYEGRFRPADKAVPSWLARQQAKIDQSLDHLEANPPRWTGHPDYGHITLAVALGYLDFRHAGKWRVAHPRLVAWVDEFAAAVPAFEKTAPPPA